MDAGLLVLVVAAGVATGAPAAAVVSALWPSRATRWAARACLAVAVGAGILLVVLAWEAQRRPPGIPPDQGWGDDSGVVLAMGSVVLLVGLVNLLAWALARRRAPRPSSEPERRPG